MTTRKLTQIHLNPENPRLIKDDNFRKLCESIKNFPKMLEIKPIVIDDLGEILAGNQRYRACKELGIKEVPVLIASELTEEQKQEFIVKDNTHYGEWDFNMLSTFHDAEILEDWGVPIYLGEDIEPIDLTSKEAKEDDFEAPPIDEIKTDIKYGDIFQIGKHRLMCGDSTKIEDVERLMDGKKAEITFTSPPYNMSLNAKLSPHQKSGSKYISSDDNLTNIDYLNFLIKFIEISMVFSKYSFVNIQSLAGNKTALIDLLYHFKKIYAETLIWDKQQAQPAMANNVLNSQFEYIYVFSEKANRAIGTKEFRGTLSNIVEISKQTTNKVKEHNATFPIALADFFISNFCLNSVLDPFLGSGSTMVACHQLNRINFGMELEPKYCQVIIDRMKKLDPSIEIVKL